MSTSPITSGTSVQSFALELAQSLDTNNDGQISTNEFSTFLSGFLKTFLGKSGTTASSIGTQALSALNSAASTATSGSSATSSGTGAYADKMLGFDLSRLQSAASSPKYAFANLAINMAPTDANMVQIAMQLGSSVGHLDSQNNFMLDGDAGGYIGVRDRGNGPMWQWMAYNDAHPGPNGEIT
jgi:hypothetical protein